MKKAIFILIIFILSLCLLQADNPTEDVKEDLGQKIQTDEKDSKTVVARGYATIKDDNIAKARDEAVKDAQIKALEQVVGVFVEAETVAKDYEALNKNIYTNTKGYVSSYKIIEGSEETRTIDDIVVYSLAIEATINLTDLYKKLNEISNLYDKIGKPKFFVLGTATSNVGGDDRDLVEGLMIEHLQEWDFDIIDKTMLSLQIESNPNMSNLLKTMKEHDIKILVMISADSTNQNLPTGDILAGVFDWSWGRWGLGRLADTNNVNTKLTLKFIDTVTEEIFYNKNISSSDFAVTITESNRKTVEDSIKKGMNSFFEKYDNELKKVLTDRWVEVGERNVYKISVDGLDRKSFMFIKDCIREKDRFIRTVTNEIFRDSKASWEITTLTDKNTFMDYLEAITYENKHIVITGIYGNIIEAHLR
ncbi:MAG: hypothetical protein IJS60_06940 [Abditibacteriota bacterium]|nr:hypothetical protein [Abditibacteriota bacterium]